MIERSNKTFLKSQVFLKRIWIMKKTLKKVYSVHLMFILKNN